MIELAFNESAAGALKMAKSMKQGDILQGAAGIIGGTGKERREAMKQAKKPRAWTGVTMEGGSKDVAPLSLYLDIGDISDTLDMEAGMPVRKRALECLFGKYPGVPDEIWKTNQNTLSRLKEAKKTLEPVRLWVCAGNPAELCGLYFICFLMQDAAAPLSVVRVPEGIEKDGNIIVSYRNTGEISPEDMGKYTEYEQPVSPGQRIVYATSWSGLARENAPLRAVVNGTLMGVPEDFYDFTLRANIPDGEFRIAQLIGRTLGLTPGIGDLWLYLRVEAMLQKGELVMVSPAGDDHHYQAVVKRSEGR
jgi:hypothetical protein